MEVKGEIFHTIEQVESMKFEATMYHRKTK